MEIHNYVPSTTGGDYDLTQQLVDQVISLLYLWIRVIVWFDSLWGCTLGRMWGVTTIAMLPSTPA